MESSQPKDLIRALHDAGIDALDRSVVEQIIARGPECLPLLLDTLNSDVDDAVLARVLALIGEIGDASALPHLFPFFAAEDEDDDAVTECAEWAGRRISRRFPAETLSTMTDLAVDADMPMLSDICKTLAAMPRVPGRAGTLLSIAKRLDDLEDDYDEALLAVTLVITAMFVDGPRGELVANVRKKAEPHLDRQLHKDIRTVEQDLVKEPHDPDETHEIDVYTLVCEGFDEEPAGPRVREEPKIGRNDPCWCGSGKKFKKCHGR
jgi:HEAT repeat protein